MLIKAYLGRLQFEYNRALKNWFSARFPRTMKFLNSLFSSVRNLISVFFVKVSNTGQKHVYGSEILAKKRRIGTILSAHIDTHGRYMYIMWFHRLH